MKKVIIENIETCPKYFKWGDYTTRINTDTFTSIFNFGYGIDITTFKKDSLDNFLGEEVQPITKAEFAIELNKAYAKISGFKHIEDKWKDEEADTHNTEEIDLLSQCELFIAGVQSYLGDDTTGKELLEKIKNYKK